MSELKKDELKREVIKITGCETKQMSNGGYMSKLTDSNDHKYTVFHLKMDKSETLAYQALKKLPMSWIGSTMEVIYKEEVFTKDGKDFTSRKAVGFNEVKGGAEVKVEAPKEATKLEDMGEVVTNQEELDTLSFLD